MEFLVVVGILIAISVLDDRVRGKKKVPPPTVPQEIPRQRRGAQKGGAFEIPPMRGIPSRIEIGTVDPTEAERALREKWETERRAAEKAAAAHRHAEKQRAEILPAAESPVMQGLPRWTPQTMQQAVVMAEILGKPRALRRFPQR
mgnify:CR=1 FL=1